MNESLPQFDAASAEQLAAAFEEVVSRVLAVSGDIQADADLNLYAAGLAQLSQVLQRVQTQPAGADPSALTTDEITELGTFGYGLIEGLRNSLPDTGMESLDRQLQALQIPLALWIVRHGGGWNEWESLTNALAELANHVQAHDRLRHLSQVMGELIDAAPAVLRGDLERLEPSRPWRVLHLNRAIVATRSLDVEAMEPAFDALLARLPEDAGAFFSEGARRVAQMDAPSAVRDCFDRYQRRAPQPTAH